MDLSKATNVMDRWINAATRLLTNCVRCGRFPAAAFSRLLLFPQPLSPLPPSQLLLPLLPSLQQLCPRPPRPLLPRRSAACCAGLPLESRSP